MADHICSLAPPILHYSFLALAFSSASIGCTRGQLAAIHPAPGYMRGTPGGLCTCNLVQLYLSSYLSTSGDANNINSRSSWSDHHHQKPIILSTFRCSSSRQRVVGRLAPTRDDQSTTPTIRRSHAQRRTVPTSLAPLACRGTLPSRPSRPYPQRRQARAADA